MSIIKGKTNTVAGVGKNGTGFTLFTPIWQDHLVNNASWLRADTFSWQSGAVYVSAYNHLVNDFNGTTSATETIGSTTITYYRSEDGHKIVLPDQENTVMAIYNATGIAWYYILDTTNKRFKLPRNKYSFTGFRDNVGNYIAPGLPDHNHTVSGSSNWGSLSQTGNAVALVTQVTTSLASASNPIYGNSDTVQYPAVQTYLYFFVGNTVEEVTTINVGQLTESLNGKADTSLNNIPTNYDYVVESKAPTTEDPSWYRVYKSGWVEQGGRVSKTSSALQVTMFKLFKDTSYSLQVTACYPGAGDSTVVSRINTESNTISSFTIQCSWQSSNGYIQWEAKGQGAS